MMEAICFQYEAFGLTASSDLTFYLDTQQLSESDLSDLEHPSTGYESKT